jgi:hypothetical protein
MPENSNYSTILKNSILTDKYIYNWSFDLISQKDARDILTKNPYSKTDYSIFKSDLIISRISFTATAAFLALGIFYGLTWLLFLVITFFGIFIFFHKKLKNKTAILSLWIIRQEIKDLELKQPTIYQISEILSRKYRIPSLVDNLYFFDSTSAILLAATALALQIFLPPRYPTLARFIFLFILYIASSFFINNLAALKKDNQQYHEK